MNYPKLTEQGISFFIYPRKDAKNAYYYRFEHDETNYHKSTKKYTPEEAEKVAREAIREIKRQTVITAPSWHYFNTIVPNYLDTTKRLLRPSTAQIRGRFFGWFLAAYPTLKIDEISIPLFHGYLNDLHSRLKPSASYWRDILSRYHQFFGWCIETGKLTFNPMQGYPRPKAKDFQVDDETWEQWEFDKIHKALEGTPEAFMLKVLRYTGIYPMDYAFLEKGHFVILDGVLHLIKQRAKNIETYRQPLDGRIEPDLLTRWNKFSLPTDRLTTNRTDEDYKVWYNEIQRRVIGTWRKHIRSSPKMLKSLRHTWLTEQIERGVPEDVLLQWAGHSPGSTILRRHYLHRKSTARYRYVEAAGSHPSLSLHNG